MDMEEARKIVKQKLTKARYEHTLRVCETAIELAERFGESTEKAALASVFHDYAKCLPEVELKQYIHTYQLPAKLLDFHHELWHGPVGAKLVEERYQITDIDILHAIQYHTSGRPHMSRLELIVFVSDYIEPGRSFPGVDEVRELALVNVESAARLALKNTIIFLLKNNATIYPDTIYAYNELTKRSGK